MKLCKDCKYFKPMEFRSKGWFDLTPPQSSQCLHPECVDPVDGSEYTVPLSRRNICGIEGKYWEQK